MAFTPANQDSSSGLRAGFRPLEVGGIPIQEKPQQNLFQKVGTQLGNFATGVAKGELSTLKGASDIVQNVARTLTGPFLGGAAEKTQKEKAFDVKARELLTPQGTAENIGFYG